MTPRHISYPRVVDPALARQIMPSVRQNMGSCAIPPLTRHVRSRLLFERLLLNTREVAC